MTATSIGCCSTADGGRDLHGSSLGVDCYKHRMLPYRLSNTMEVDFCVDALKKVLRNFGTPEIFNLDQGAQFTSEAFTGLQKE